MSREEKLLEKARNNPSGLRFDDLVLLATYLGFEQVRESGSHKLFRHSRGDQLREEFNRLLNLQPRQDGKAKAHQVKQMLQMVDALASMEEPNDKTEDRS